MRRALERNGVPVSAPDCSGRDGVNPSLSDSDPTGEAIPRPVRPV